ncbi:cytochrome P450 [Streptomyces olivoreticuli]
MEGLREQVRAAADRLAGRLAAVLDRDGRADLVTEFANPLPLLVIGDLLGVPEADRGPFSSAVSTMFAPEHPGQVAEAVERIHRFLLGLVAARRAEPGDDLLSALIAARDEGDRPGEDELVSLAFLILMAGSENTQHLISGGLLTLFGHPAQLAEVRADPSLLPDAVEELLRYAHPNQMAIRRFPTEPVDIGGVRIPPGDTVLLCLGAALARTEIRIALDTLLRRFPRLALAVPRDGLRWRASFRSHALRELPVTDRQPRAPARPGR